MAYCEFCPLRKACVQINEFLTERPINDQERQIVEAAQTILSIEGTDYSQPCEDRLPKVEREYVDGRGEYLLICSDDDRQGIAEYLADIVHVGDDFLPEEEFEKRYPWISIVQRLKKSN